MTSQPYNGIESTENAMQREDVQDLNEGNQWMAYLNTGKKQTPYLQTEGRLKKNKRNERGKRVRPAVSIKQRRIFNA